MEYRRLGETDLKVSRVGFGASAIGGHEYGSVDDRESERAVRAALDHGITFFDTADVYGLGHSETVLGRALGSDATKVTIAAKFGVVWDESGRTFKDCNPQRVVTALEASLRRLGVERISLYQLHWHDGRTPIEEAVLALDRCRRQGKIGYVGCSNLSAEHFARACAVAPVVSLQFSYGLADRDAECSGVVSGLIAAGAPGIVYNVLGRGLLTGKFGANASFVGTDTRVRDAHFQGERFSRLLRLTEQLKTVARECGRQPGQVAIRWTLGRPGVAVALTGIKRPEQAVENAAATDWVLPDHCRRALDQASDAACMIGETQAIEGVGNAPS